MTTTTANNFRKRVGKFINLAQREAVIVTCYGRPFVVLLPAEDYRRLRDIEARATRRVRVADLPDETIEAIRDTDLSHLPTI